MNKTENKLIHQFKKQNHMSFLVAILAQCLQATANIAIAFVIMYTVEGMEFSDRKRIRLAVLILIGLIIAYIISGIGVKIFKNKYIKKALYQFKKYIFKNILGKSISEFREEKTEKIINAFSNDLGSIETNYLSGGIEIVMNIVMFIGASIAMGCINGILMICVLAACVAPAAVGLTYGKKLVEKEKKTSDENEGFVGQVNDLLSGFLVIKSFKAEKEAMDLFMKQNFTLEEAKQQRRETNDALKLASDLSQVLVVTVIFSVGSYFAFQKIMTIGEVLAFVQLSNYLMLPITKVIPLWSNRKAAKKLIQKMADVIEVDEKKEEMHSLSAFQNKICLEDITFGYEERKNVLNRVNIEFEKGKSYAIVGSSGSGKSTLIQLLLGYFKNYAGNVMYDEIELCNASLDSLYDMVSVVQQNVFMFDATLEDNITMFKSFSQEKIDEAVERAGLSNLVEEKGLEYMCGEGGKNLSGGERQRVSIARSLLRNTPILLMDEATAALDNQTGHEVTKQILQIQDLTRIIVTHKLEESLLKQYDKIFTLKDGKVTEEGKFEELMQKKGYFYSLYNVSV